MNPLLSAISSNEYEVQENSTEDAQSENLETQENPNNPATTNKYLT